MELPFLFSVYFFYCSILHYLYSCSVIVTYIFKARAWDKPKQSEGVTGFGISSSICDLVIACLLIYIFGFGERATWEESYLAGLVGLNLSGKCY